MPSLRSEETRLPLCCRGVFNVPPSAIFACLEDRLRGLVLAQFTSFGCLGERRFDIRSGASGAGFLFR